MADREHVTDGSPCWCDPEYFLTCEDCDADEVFAPLAEGDPVPADLPGCWKCEKGLIRLTRAEAEASDVPVLIVHNGALSTRAAP